MSKHKRWRTTAAIQQRARALRRNMTPAERALWARLRNRQLDGLKFRRQHPIGRFIVDFCCIECKLVVEVDGDSHAARQEYDQDRTSWLERQGFKVVRFTNRQIRRNLEGVLLEIARQCRAS